MYLKIYIEYYGNWKCNLFMKNKLSVHMKCMLQMTSWFDVLTDSLLVLLGTEWETEREEVNLSKAKPIIRTTFNFQSMWNCIIMKSSSGRLKISGCVCICRVMEMLNGSTEQKRKKLLPCRSMQHSVMNLSTIYKYMN